MNETSGLSPALEHLVQRSARGMVARARLSSAGLNRFLLRELARAPGSPDALMADPVFEMAKAWEAASSQMKDLDSDLLSSELLDALAKAKQQAMPADLHPYVHQLIAWEQSLKHKRSVLVSAGTGAGKTECFLIPILEDILANPHTGGGVRAILLYPLNALIESQRERLAAWANELGGRVRFALFNGDTVETEREAKIKSTKVELRSRTAIRDRPPEILVTNITMLEYLLLRAKDRSILDTSQGALRWIVLDEAHSYVGSQAAEMALLLRRVRSGFGVTPGQVRLIATSATIGGEDDALEKLTAFGAALAGRPESDIAVVEGHEVQPDLPPPGPDSPLDPAVLEAMTSSDAGSVLAVHPRIQTLQRTMADKGIFLSEVAQVLINDTSQISVAIRLLEVAGRASWQNQLLLPWRVHLFHRALGGIWACTDSSCPHMAKELTAENAGWYFGSVWTKARSRCDCGAPVFEVVACSECGREHLQGMFVDGTQPRLDPPEPGEGDDFALDAEPEEDDTPKGMPDFGWLATGQSIWLAEDGRIFDNRAPEDKRAWQFRLINSMDKRNCCPSAEKVRLMGLRYGPAFIMGNAIGGVLEDLAPPAGAPGLPAGGRKALTFSDSRQGVARLAAKLQQEAERSMTRAFLWHAVQEGSQADPENVRKLKSDIARLKAAGLDDLAEDKERALAAQTGSEPTSIPWLELVRRLAGHADLTNFAGEIWRSRMLGESLGNRPSNLAEMFLYRELFRRPRVQNNPETMGLLRLTFPKMEKRARNGAVPAPLAEAGIDNEGWLGLVQAAIDLEFRQALAVEMKCWIVPVAAPRFGKLNMIHHANTRTEDLPPKGRRWPNPSNKRRRLLRLIYSVIAGDPEDTADQDKAGVILDALWVLITTTAAYDFGRGGFRLKFEWAAVIRLDEAWLCPVTRRPYGYSIDGRSPNDPSRKMERISLPRLPTANAGGLTSDQRDRVSCWIENDDHVAKLRSRGLWTNLHDRMATFPSYVRAQEHSAQIARPTLQRYEEEFKAGRINLLNCSTTMEMGVDLADVRLVLNANVPPAVSNYRQRSGRAGRRGEPWAFTLTFCRDLPLDRRVAEDPAMFLRRPIVAPRVLFDSRSLVQRHVNAALLAIWLSEQGGQNVKGSIGSFMGAGTTESEPVLPDAQVDALLADLKSSWSHAQSERLMSLVKGTVLEGKSIGTLVKHTIDALKSLIKNWRREHRLLLDAAAAAKSDRDARRSMELRAKRLSSEFLLGEIARRGFTPAYGFPTDVVIFDNIVDRVIDDSGGASHFRRGCASRELDQAVREYAPGAEVVIDGLVHLSEGILPAWKAGVNASGLEDLRTFWSCPACHAFDLDSSNPIACEKCGHPTLEYRKVLRPAGFLGARPAHVGYENLSFVIADPVRVTAQAGEWLPAPNGAGRLRADPAGRVITSAAGSHGGGFAICLDCGRAEPMEIAQTGIPKPPPDAIKRHKPLLWRKTLRLTEDGFCPSADAPQRIQLNVHLAQVKNSDVWEWQLPTVATEESARALAAALRETLSERLGVEPAEIIPSADVSTGVDGEARVSVFLHDRAAGGAGLATRMVDLKTLATVLEGAANLLDCPEECGRGCPSCILRPDLNQRDITLDRPAALALTKELRSQIT